MPVTESKSNPEPAEGQIHKEDLVQPNQQNVVAEDSGSKSNKEVAQEVIAGRWSRGRRRKQRLQDAGYDVAAVEKEIAKILNQK